MRICRELPQFGHLAQYRNSSSRGIPAEVARRLVIRGFFAEIIGKIKSEDIENRLMERIDSELAKVGA